MADYRIVRYYLSSDLFKSDNSFSVSSETDFFPVRESAAEIALCFDGERTSDFSDLLNLVNAMKLMCGLDQISLLYKIMQIGRQ